MLKSWNLISRCATASVAAVASVALIHMDLCQQSLSVGDISLPPVGPVDLQPLLLSLGVLQHALPSQALQTQHRTTTTAASVPRCEHCRLFAVLFPPASAATELFPIPQAEGPEFGQQDPSLTGALQGRRGPQQ